MPAHVRTVEVPEADRQELQRRVRDKAAPARVVERARIVLLAADEVPGKEIAAIVGCAEGTVVTWRGRYAEHGLPAISSPPSSGSSPPGTTAAGPSPGPTTPTPSSPRPPTRGTARQQRRQIRSTKDH
jgi:Homeodomain-like domain